MKEKKIPYLSFPGANVNVTAEYNIRTNIQTVDRAQHTTTASYHLRDENIIELDGNGNCLCTKFKSSAIYRRKKNNIKDRISYHNAFN